MPVQTVIAKNVTANPVVLPRLGVTILGNQQLTLSDFFRTEELWEASDLSAAVTAGDIVINDGSGDLTTTPGLRWITPPLASSNVDLELDSSSSTPAANVLVRYDANGQLVIKETGDPTNLTFGAVANGQFLKRVGTNIVGIAAPSGTGDVVGPASATNNAIALFDTTTGKLIKDSATLITSLVGTARQVIAGAGLTGGGALSADVTLNAIANADGSIVVNANDLQVGVLATDAQHGNRGGGGIHALVIAAGAAGFMSGADKTKLDGVASGATNTTLSSTTPAAVGTATVGVGTTAARADHVHAHGTQLGGTLHALSTALLDGFMSAADKVKVNGLPAGGTAIRQSILAAIVADTTTNSASFVNLLSQNITITAGGIITVIVSGSVSNSVRDALTNLKLFVNGVAQRASQLKAQGNDGVGGVAMNARVAGLAAGTYAVLLQWKVSAGNGQIRPVTGNPDGESLSMLITEVTA
jgi:hypothetical protein